MTTPTPYSPTNASVSMEDRIRQKIIAEMVSAGGWPEGRVSLEVLYLLPREFTNAYVALFYDALVEQAGSRPTPEADTPALSSTPTTEAGKARKTAKRRSSGPLQFQGQHGGGKKYKTHWVIRSERALHKKQRTDAKLRELAQAMASNDASNQCPGCKKWLQPTWRYCPGCGQGSGANKGK